MTVEPSRLWPVLFLVAAGVALAVLLTACGPASGPADPVQPAVQGESVLFPDGSPQLKALATAEALIEKERTLVVAGRVIWDEGATSRVFAPVAGRIVSLEAKPGDRVRKGQVLARLTSPEFGQALADARRAQADVSASERSYKRVRELGEAGVSPRKDVEAAEADYSRTVAEFERTTGRLRAWGALGAQDQIFPLVSPIDGVVVERSANPGQEFRPDQAGPGASPLFTISDPSRLWVQLEVPEGAMGLVRPGLATRVTADAAPEAESDVTIDFVPDGLDPVTRTLRVRGSLRNDPRRFKAEMFVRGKALLPGSGVPVIPAAAVLLVGGRHVAFVETRPGRYTRREVRAEDAGIERMRIMEGVAAGEKVVVEGALFLQQILAASTGS
jgi:cobalt-zinc-cadmium efflux system membrane fusion protein